MPKLAARAKVLVAVAVAAGAVLIVLRVQPRLLRLQARPEPLASPPETVAAPEIETWKDAARRVEESRGKPVGRRARVTIPRELSHYADRRRFLAVQIAETREQDFELPQDWAELAYMVRDGELMHIAPLGADYILYGVGGEVNEKPFTHHDRATGMDIPLYPSYAEFKQGDADVAREVEGLRAQAAERRTRHRKTPLRLRTRRNALLREARFLDAEAGGLTRRRQRTAYFYEDDERRQSLIGEHDLLRNLAQEFGDPPYDLDDPNQRRILKGRLLSHLRPQALDLMLDVAADYHSAFARRLPISSLVRSLDYQALLGETNPNATSIEEPPHASGLAFDVYYGHMDSDEQEHVMRRLALLEQQGRLEVLRETREHFHVFAFPDGQPPPSRLVAGALDDIGPAPRGARSSLRAPAAASRPSPPSRVRAPGKAQPPHAGGAR